MGKTRRMRHASAAVACCALVAMAFYIAVEACSQFRIRAIWAKSTRSSHPLFRFVEGGKVGFIDAMGKVVIPPRFDTTANETGDFVEGLARVRLGGQWGFIDVNGEFAVEPRYFAADDFSEGLARVYDREAIRTSLYIDRAGDIVISGDFQGSDFSQGLASIRLPGERGGTNEGMGYLGRAGYIDQTGRIVIEPRFAVAGRFSEGLARVALDGECWLPGGALGRAAAPSVPMMGSCGDAGKDVRDPCPHGFIDRSGELRIAAEFTNARDFHEGYAAVEVDGKWGFIDHSGRFLAEPAFDDAKSFREGRAAVRMDDRWGYIDRAGRWVMPPLYKSADSFSQGLAVARDEEGIVYLNRNGEEVLRPDASLATSFVWGLAQLRVADDRFAYIDKNGQVVFEYDANDFVTDAEPRQGEGEDKGAKRD